MKKLYTEEKYKRWQQSKLRKLKNKHKSLKKSKKELKSTEKPMNEIIKPKKLGFKEVVYAPVDCRLIENTESVLDFFRKLRSEDSVSIANFRFVIMSLERVELIDYAAISILTAICDDLKIKNIIIKADLPKNTDCKKNIVEGGFLNNMLDEKGRRFPKSTSSEVIFFTKGKERLSELDNKNISILIKKVIEHLTGESKYYQPLQTIILEICGNSIEWGNTKKKQWVLGVKYETNKVIFNVVDVGVGILDNLFRKFSNKIKDFFTLRDDSAILMRAFDQKYDSTTLEENRNKGLPSIKSSFKNGKIKSLKVVTNNVILHFDNNKESRVFKSNTRLNGTFYQWEMSKDCITNNI